MDKILFARRLKARRIECGYSSKRAFAMAYDRRYKNGAADLVGNNPHKSTQSSLKNYEDGEHRSIPSVEVVANICEMLDCDIDYLLGKIDHPKHIHQAMNEMCGLSEKATENLIYWKGRHVDYTGMLNIILESDNFEHALHHAINFSEIVPILEGLRKIRTEQLEQIYATKPDCGDAYNVPNGHNALCDMIREKEKEYAAERLYLDDNLTFLVQEIEKIAKKK